LWFLIALFGAACIHYLFVAANKANYKYYIAVPIALLVFNSFLAETEKNQILQGFAYFAIGFIFGKYNIDDRITNVKYKKFSWLKWLLLGFGIGAIFLQFIEQYFSPYLWISALISSTLILSFLASCRLSLNLRWLDKHIAFNIYVIHYRIGIIMRKVIDYGIVLALAVYVISFAICEVWFLLKSISTKISTNVDKCGKTCER
jgi:hypothetical protein